MFRKVLIAIVIIIVLAGAGYLFVTRTKAGEQALSTLPGRSDASAGSPGAQFNGEPGTQNGEGVPEDLSTVQIRPAESILGEVSASGNIELVSQRAVAMEVDGEVVNIFVKPGDVVVTGDLLLSLDTVALERDAQRARLSVESAKNKVDQITEPADEPDLAAAAADLAEARENLADTLQGPSEEEIAAMRSTLASARARLSELLEGPSDAELTQLSADFKRKEVALSKAQSDFDEISWSNTSGMSSQAVNLQQATIDYESALAAKQEATADADASDIASAQGDIQDAQHKLGDLLDSPTEAEIAQAQAKVAQAEASLIDLETGPSDLELAEAQISLEKTIVDLEEAYNDLAMAQVTAPVDGTVLEINVDPGQRVSRNAVVATLADISQLELTIDVAEIDIAKVQPDQPASIEIDALPERTFNGVVDYIAPASDSSSGLVNYSVTIRLEDGMLEGVRPGMTAVATLMNTSAGLANAWLVPSNSLRQRGDGSVVMVMREGGPQPVPIEVGNAEGEWIVVRSSDLQTGDEVVGSLTTFVGEDEFQFGGGGMRPPGGGLGGGGR